MIYEKNISTQQDQKKENTRIPRSHGHQGRQSCDRGPEKKGQKTLNRIKKNLPKSARLLKRVEYTEIRRFGKKMFGCSVVIGYLPGPEKNSAKIGITVSKKYGNAVRRNYFKRLCREVLRNNRQYLPPGLSLNFSARYTKDPVSYERIKSDFYRLLKSVKDSEKDDKAQS